MSGSAEMVLLGACVYVLRGVVNERVRDGEDVGDGAERVRIFDFSCIREDSSAENCEEEEEEEKEDVEERGTVVSVWTGALSVID